MPPKKKKSRSRSAARKKKQPVFPRVIIAILIVVLFAGIAAVKYFQTPAGRARLLDSGFDGYYDQVQSEIGLAIRGALKDEGLLRRIDQRVVFDRAHGKSVRCLEWRITCDRTCDYVIINVALTKAVRSAGGRVRRSREADDGKTFLFSAGTGKFDTHRLRFVQAEDREVAKEEKRHPLVALVIDDLGYSRDGVVGEILTLDLPLTVAILPSLPYSTFALKKAQEEGKCTILHLPMEPDEETRSDLSMVTTDMDEADIRRLVTRYVQSLPGIEGVNNHQGSLATSDPRVMKAVLAVLRDYGLFFLDSLTSNKSIAYNTARTMGIPTARNGVFLDADTEDPDVVEQRIRQLVSRAQANGTAVGIGHPRTWTLDALTRSRAFLKSADVELVYLRDIVE
jgi:polysaccharide deacetylase 2 family uncharacterized protein YibQ